MAKNKDIENILLKLAQDLTRIADKKLTDEVKEVYREEIDYMYDEYEPKEYMRRYYDNGFGDDNNWEVDVTPKNNGVELDLINETETYNPSNYRLDKLIEEGMGRLPKERPVYQRTSDRLKSEQVVENTLKSELSKLGYKFK